MPSLAAEAISVTKQIWGDVAKNGITEAELRDAQTYLTGSFPLNLDSNGAIAAVLMQLRRDRLPIDQIERRNALINAVTREDVLRAARRLLDPARLVTVVVGKPEGLVPAAAPSDVKAGVSGGG